MPRIRVRDDVAKARGLLTGDFLADFTRFTDVTVIPEATQNRVSSTTTVKAVGVTAADDTSATVLVFADQIVTRDTETPNLRFNSARLHLVKVDGRWLVEDFDPV